MPKGRVREIIQLDAETDEVIEVYESLKAAAEDNYVHPRVIKEALESDGTILKKGLKFKYGNEQKHIGGKCACKVLELSPVTGEVLNEYESISYAARKNHVSISSISDAVRGKNKTCLGNIWIKKRN